MARVKICFRLGYNKCDRVFQLKNDTRNMTYSSISIIFTCVQNAAITDVVEFMVIANTQ